VGIDTNEQEIRLTAEPLTRSFADICSSYAPARPLCRFPMKEFEIVLLASSLVMSATGGSRDFDAFSHMKLSRI
jgi:hypothetical protein